MLYARELSEPYQPFEDMIREDIQEEIMKKKIDTPYGTPVELSDGVSETINWVTVTKTEKKVVKAGERKKLPGELRRGEFKRWKPDGWHEIVENKKTFDPHADTALRWKVNKTLSKITNIDWKLREDSFAVSFDKLR